MTLRLTLAALALAVLPGAALAACGSAQKQMSTSACADGQTWDASAQTCVDASA